MISERITCDQCGKVINDKKDYVFVRKFKKGGFVMDCDIELCSITCLDDYMEDIDEEYQDEI